MNQKTLPEQLLQLGTLWQKIKHLDRETRRKIMANPELASEYINEMNTNDSPVANNNTLDELTI